MWTPENILKGRMAEALVEELLASSGNKVYHFGYETVLQNLTQSDREFDRETETGQQISSIPDFVVLNQSRKPFFVEVKFRFSLEHHIEELISELKKIQKFWRAKVILVTVQKPYLRVFDPPYFNNGNLSFKEPEDDPDLVVGRRELQAVERLVEKYFDRRFAQARTGK